MFLFGSWDRNIHYYCEFMISYLHLKFKIQKYMHKLELQFYIIL